MNPNWSYPEIKEYVNKYWDSHRNTTIPVDNSSFVPYEPKANQAEGSANEVSKRTYNKTCDHCVKYKERKFICHTHNTDKCFYGDNPGRTRLPEYQNKSDSTPYSFLTFHDSGSTPTSYFKDRPTNFVKKIGEVKTADSSHVKTTGYGSIKIGNMQLQGVVHVPTFSHNLLSGIQVMRAGYKQVIDDDKIKIYDKSNQLVASGEYDPNYGLFESGYDPNYGLFKSVQHTCNSSLNLSLMDWHYKIGHISESLLR